LYSLENQLVRVRAARDAADENGVHAFVNARTDIFLKAKPDAHNDAMVDEAIERAKAYEQVGADGFFAPGMVNEAQIARLCEAVALPVNLLVMDHTPTQETFAELGVSRVSYGSTVYGWMLKWLRAETQKAYAPLVEPA